jgi:hypothetical protein
LLVEPVIGPVSGRQLLVAADGDEFGDVEISAST